MRETTPTIAWETPIDLSMTIEPHWRFKPEFGEKEISKPEFIFHSTILHMGAHAFSHCDAPFHVDPSAATIDVMPLTDFFGPGAVVDVSDLGDDAALTREVLEERVAHVRPDDIVLLRSSHALRHPTSTREFWTRSPYVTASAAELLAELRVKAIGFDFPQDRAIREDYDPDFVALERPVEDWACHTLLLPHGVGQIEYLENMEAITTPRIMVFALPLKVAGADGGPARVVAFEEIER